jgi:hypothetical protein
LLEIGERKRLEPGVRIANELQATGVRARAQQLDELGLAGCDGRFQLGGELPLGSTITERFALE